MSKNLCSFKKINIEQPLYDMGPLKSEFKKTTVFVDS